MLKIVETRKDLEDLLAPSRETSQWKTLNQAAAILEQVQKDGDQALFDLTRKFDGIGLDSLEASADEIERQAAKADTSFVQALKEAAENIEEYHLLQKRQGYELKREDGSVLGSRVLPLQKVGLYVPGGRAQYPSSVLMNAIPAKIAGVEELIVVTPPDQEGSLHPNLAAAIRVAGVDRVFKVGGAQAVGALAYGTESVPKVDKIVGPGNSYVAQAKRLVFGDVDIDMIAGPSEILVLADQSADPAFIAADLLSQAEHDPQARAILVTPSRELIDQVNQQLFLQVEELPKKEIAKEALKNGSFAFLAEDLFQAAEVANRIAPEHLELQVEEPFAMLEKITNAGSVFLGKYSCESVGDYFAGVNHVLPTSGTARFSSPLSVDDFIKKSSYLYYPENVLKANGKKIMILAREEDLEAHARAVEIRL